MLRFQITTKMISLGEQEEDVISCTDLAALLLLLLNSLLHQLRTLITLTTVTVPPKIMVWKTVVNQSSNHSTYMSAPIKPVSVMIYKLMMPSHMKYTVITHTCSGVLSLNLVPLIPRFPR